MFKVLWPVSRYSLGKELQSLGLSTENARSRHEFRQYDGMTTHDQRRSVDDVSVPSQRQEEHSRQLDTEARYRWGNDKSRWWLYTWRAEARQASGDCHTSAASNRRQTSSYQLQIFPHKTRFVSKNTGQEPVAKIITQKTGQEPIAETITWPVSCWPMVYMC